MNLKKRKKSRYFRRNQCREQAKKALGLVLALLGGILIIQGVPLTVWYALLILLAAALTALLIRYH